METRKLQVSGHSTYILSLPKEWIKKNEVNKGDNIRLRLQPDGTIILSPAQNELKAKEAKLTVTEDSDKLFRKFIGLYLAGYKTIKLRFEGDDGGKAKKSVKRIIEKFSGLEIVSESNETMTVQDLFDSSLFTPDKAIRRMTLLTISMLNDAILSFETKDNNLAQDVISRDDNVDWLGWLITRQYNLILQDIALSEKLGISQQKGLGYLLIAKSLERIADHTSKIASNSNKSSLNNDLLISDVKQMANHISYLLDVAIKSFYSENFDDANNVLREAKELQNEEEALVKNVVTNSNLDPPETISNAFILDSMNRICSYTMEIAEVAINTQYITD